jgi:hypothetical protein
MTWKEFKQKVEAEIKENGFDENIKILYIDINGSDEFSVSASNENGLAID